MSAATYAITRHAATRTFLKSNGYAKATFLEHLNPDQLDRLKPGDVVVGTLPVNLVAAINSKGASYLHLSLDTPQGDRGKELTDISALNPRFEPFQILSVPPPKPRNSSKLKSRTVSRGTSTRWELLTLSAFALICGSFSMDLLKSSIFASSTNALLDFICGSVLFLGFVYSVYYASVSGLRLLSVHTHTLEDEVVPKKVLITGLSLAAGSSAETLKLAQEFLAFVRLHAITLDQAALPADEFQKLLTRLSGDPKLGNFNWLPNLVAVNAHRSALQKILVLPSNKTDDTVLGLFKELVHALYTNTLGPQAESPVVEGRQRADYDNFDEVLSGLTVALKSTKLPSSEVCFDITPGSKQFSICAALATLDNDSSFFYVDFGRHFRQINTKIEFGKASV